VIPTSKQDGHQAKNRKKGDEIVPLEMHFFVDSLLLVTQIIKGKQLYYKSEVAKATF
jgi:tmRNA-binding protein